MKKIVLSLVVVASVLTACKESKKENVKVAELSAPKVAETKVASDNVDVKSSVLTWVGTKPTGSHNGIVLLKNGSLTLENGTVAGGEFLIDMSTIECKDLKGGTAAKLVGHLTSADFFDITKYPTSKFVITSVADKGDKIHVTGNLTIKDVTKSITIPATVSTVDGVTTFESEKFVVNRADFNVKYGSKSFFDNLKDKFIDDNMELSFVVKTKA